jgi:hypothetical protein
MDSQSSRVRFIWIAILVAVGIIGILFAINRGQVAKEVVQKGKSLIEEGEAYIYGMESWIYGYPIVLMDVTWEMMTAVPAPNSDGTAAPINQLGKMPHYKNPPVKKVQ